MPEGAPTASIRTLDDVISLKTISQQPDTVTETDEIRNVVVKGNVFWGEVAHVLTIGTQVEAFHPVAEAAGRGQHQDPAQ